MTGAADTDGQPTLRRSLGFLAGSRFVFNTSTRFIYPFLPEIARSLGVSLSAVGLLQGARWLVGIATPGIVQGVGGELHRRLIRLALGLFVVGAIVTAWTGVFVGAVVGFILMGLAKPTFDITSQAYISDRVPYERRARMLAIFELTWAASLLIGAPAAGWVLSRFGWSAVFWLFGLLIALAFVATRWTLQPDSVGEHGTRPGVVWSRSGAALIGVVALFNLAAESMFVAYAAWLEAGFALSLGSLGVTAVLIGLAELAGEGSTIAFTDRIGKRRSVAIGLLVAAVGFAGVGLAQSTLWLGMAMLLLAVFGFEFTIVSTVPLSTEMAPRSRTMYLAWSIVATSIGRFVGAGMGVFLFESRGVGANAAVAALANLAGLALLLAFVREVRSGSDSGRQA